MTSPLNQPIIGTTLWKNAMFDFSHILIQALIRSPTDGVWFHELEDTFGFENEMVKVDLFQFKEGLCLCLYLRFYFGRGRIRGRGIICTFFFPLGCSTWKRPQASRKRLHPCGSGPVPGVWQVFYATDTGFRLVSKIAVQGSNPVFLNRNMKQYPVTRAMYAWPVSYTSRQWMAP